MEDAAEESDQGVFLTTDGSRFFPGKLNEGPEIRDHYRFALTISLVIRWGATRDRRR
jgi:hypothetical protein